ncbi:MAG: HypC/HybG/HupF family hydrogenase formation chaperone [Candidatus Pacebacteria bacterium]|nr:HypC/HybG/HupF family hydrogenase formation chaperone [Candidatus Paceibacterota bacterium]
MCLAIPLKIKKIEGDWAVASDGNLEKKVNLSLVKGVEVGDYVLAHADMALNKVEKDEAERILEMTSNLEEHNCECHEK